MSLIDPRAIIDPTARLADGVQVGPWSIIGPDVEIGEGTVVGPHVVIKGPTRIGKHNRIFQFSSVGEDTPDLKYKGEPTRLVIGDHHHQAEVHACLSPTRQQQVIRPAAVAVVRVLARMRLRRRIRRPPRRVVQPCSLMAISATRLPWNLAPSSSCAEGCLEPSLSDVVVMP